MSKPYTQKVEIGDATLYCGDCLDIMPTLGTVDTVITDPPYSDEAHSKGRRVLTKGRDLGRTRSVDPKALPFPALTGELRRAVCEWAAANCNGWMLAFCQAESIAQWRADIEQANARWIRAMVWVKPDSAPQLSGDRPAQGYESIATAWCGDGRSRWNGGGRRGVFTFTKHDKGFGHGGMTNNHPTQKPITLMQELVFLFSDSGDIVADPFMGSGTTGVACANLGRKFIGIEKERKYFDIACERIEMAYAQGRMFA